MELYEDRIINGILKSNLSGNDPEQVRWLLSRDVEIVAASGRATSDDLWPCIWALASVLERQFYGRVFIRCGLSESLESPNVLGPRVVFTPNPIENALQIGIGTTLLDGETREIWGDVRGPRISYRQLIDGRIGAHPISSFALAGYLGYAALATVVGIPPFCEDYTEGELTLPFPEEDVSHVEDGLTIIGLGQLGQAYLALLFFLLSRSANTPRLVLLDKDTFEAPNRATQILLDDRGLWDGAPKAQFLEGKLRRLGLEATGEITTLKWAWRRPAYHPRLALLGLDEFDTRRMAIGAGYNWLVEAGLGTSFLQPRVTWHSLPPDRRLGRIFERNDRSHIEDRRPDTEFKKRLYDTPGKCGWVTYNNVAASAPSMGLVAAAFVWCETLRYYRGERFPEEGRACLWSPLLPFWRSGIH
jgi:hypothetical protein